MPVTAVTPIQRPYPISVEVPSQFCSSPAPEQSMANTTSSANHQKDPNGYGIAASLPTAFIQPSLIKAGLSSSLLVCGLSSDADSMWNLKEKYVFDDVDVCRCICCCCFIVFLLDTNPITKSVGGVDLFAVICCGISNYVLERWVFHSTPFNRLIILLALGNQVEACLHFFLSLSVIYVGYT